MKTIATCRDTIEADIIRCRLEDNGINAYITQKSEVSYLSSYLEHYSTFIEVEDDDYINACNVLGIKPPILHCPQCEDINITEEYPHTRFFWQRWMRYILHPSRIYYRCLKCGHIFYKES